ncbi:glycosyltransferase [Enterococcus sp. LJL120]
MNPAETVVVIPSLEPDGKLIQLLKNIRQRNRQLPILIINDGSGPAYQPIFQEAVTDYQANLINFSENQGKGAALKKAMAVIQADYPDSKQMVTIDSDGQHSYEDMMKCVAFAAKNPDALVLGTRSFGKEVPFRSKFGNILTRNILRLTTGINIEDTQTGLRVIPVSMMADFEQVAGNRFEYETNMLIETKKNQWPLLTQPISTIYLEENASSHFRVIADSVAIYGIFFKYLLSSVASFLVDVVAYAILIHLLTNLTLSAILLASIGARIISAIFNYFVNRELVFNEDSSYSLVNILA